VERVNRDIIKVLRSLVSEFRTTWLECPSLFPLRQSALSSYKSISLAGNAPMTVFTGLPAYNPLAIVAPGSDKVSFKTSRMEPDENLV